MKKNIGILLLLICKFYNIYAQVNNTRLTKIEYYSFNTLANINRSLNNEELITLVKKTPSAIFCTIIDSIVLKKIDSALRSKSTYSTFVKNLETGQGSYESDSTLAISVNTVMALYYKEKKVLISYYLTNRMKKIKYLYINNNHIRNKDKLDKIFISSECK